MTSSVADLMRRNLLDVQPSVVTGMDIAHCRDGVIVELYTLITEARQPA
ncbi:hypothetical protein ACGF12_29705 [Kitasatospora sp. NPDC048296]